jgi:O-antigen/teichoic acid export membrane protein
VAAKVSDYLKEIDRFGISAITPKLAERGGVDDEARPRIMAKCTRYVFLALLPMHLGVAALSEPITRLYAGSEYTEAAIILSILAVYGFVHLLHGLMRAQIQVYAPPVHLLSLQGIAAVTNLSAIGVLVWTWGAVGAALAQLVTFVLLTIVASVILARSMPLRYDRQALRSALTAGLLMAAVCVIVVQLVPRASIAAAVGVLLGGATYVGALRGRIARQDLELLRRALPGPLFDLRPVKTLWEWLAAWLVPSQDGLRGAQTGGGAE